MYNNLDNSLILAQSPDRYKRYYPKETFKKELNKRIEIINNTGQILKSIQAKLYEGVESSNNEFHLIEKQIASLSHNNNYIYTAQLESNLSLDDIKNINYEDGTIEAILGKYDDIDNKTHNNILLNIDKNILVLSNNTKERENTLNTILYTTINKYTTDELNYYIVDYENKSFKKYQNIPHIGDIIYKEDKDKITNFYSLFKSEIERRKSLDVNSLSKVIIIINNYNEFIKNNDEEEFQELLNKSNKYGIYYIVTNDNINSISNKTKELFKEIITLHLKEDEYKKIYNAKKVITIKDTIGRGLYYTNNNLYEYQTLIIPDTKVKELSKSLNNSSSKRVKRIPIFPRYLDYDFVKYEIDNLTNVPISITKKELQIIKYDYTKDTFHIMLSKNIKNTKFFVNSLVDTFNKIKNTKVFIIDPLNILNIKRTNYYVDNFDEVINKLDKYFNRLIDRESNTKGTPIIIINSLKELLKNISDNKYIDNLFKLVKKVNRAIVIINEEEKSIANLSELPLFKKNIYLDKGIWIGKKINNQNIFKIDEQVKESYMDVGYLIDGENVIPSKLINFYSREEESNEKR